MHTDPMDTELAAWVADQYRHGLPCDCDVDHLCNWCRFVDAIDTELNQHPRRDS